MKFVLNLVLLVVWVSVVSAAPQEGQVTMKMFRDAEKVCHVKFPAVTVAMLEEIKKTRNYPENAIADLKCFLDCIGREIKVIDDKNNYHFEKLKWLTIEITGGSMSYDEAHAKLLKCMEADHPEPCEKAHKYVICKSEILKDQKYHKDFCDECDL